MAQRFVAAQRVDHHCHELVDQLAGRREAVHADPGLCLLIEDDVVKIVAVMPDTELGAHTVMTDG